LDRTTGADPYDYNTTLPKINNSMDSLDAGSVSGRDQKKRNNNIGSKSLDHPRMATIPIVDSMGNEFGVNQNTESAETLTVFDTKKWKRIINGNVEIIQKKVDQSTPHHVLYRELDDLKMIVANCFDQLSKSIGRQIEQVKTEAQQNSKMITLQDQAGSTYGNKQRGLNRDESLPMMVSPKRGQSAMGLDLNSVEVLNKI